MSKDKSLETMIDEIPAPNDPRTLVLIDEQIAEMQQRRQQHAEQARMQDAMFLGAIQSLEQLREKAVARAQEDDEPEDTETPKVVYDPDL